MNDNIIMNGVASSFFESDKICWLSVNPLVYYQR